MGPGFGRQCARHIDQRWGQHRGGWAGDGSLGRLGRPVAGGRGRQGPPPWVAGLFGLAQGPAAARAAGPSG